jgi:5-methyltetrahydropteroyltriglutamate--homocysteine methyltransferase
MFGAIPKRYNEVILKQDNEEIDLYFAMARGYQKNGLGCCSYGNDQMV